MQGSREGRTVRTEMEVRVTLANRAGEIPTAFTLLRRCGGKLHAYLVYAFGEKLVGLFVCEHATEAALALQEAGLEVETETVVVVRTERDRGAAGHLLTTLEQEGITVSYTYATGTGEELLVLIRTDDNARAEDVLRSYLDA